MAQVNDRAAALLDDPGHRRFSSNYLRAHIDQQNEALMLTLERIGVQQQEQEAIFNLPSGTSDLSPYFATGQPLSAFLRPTSVEWKVVGQPDTSYADSEAVKELDDVDPSNLGCQQYRWAGGTMQVTPSGTAVTLRIFYMALTATVFDSSANIMRGVGFILASQVAEYVCSLQNGMGTLQKTLTKQVQRDKQNLNNLFVMQQQSQLIVPPGIRRGGTTRITAGGNSLI